MTCGRMAPPPAISGSSVAMSVDGGRTIEPRVHTSRREEGSVRCSGAGSAQKSFSTHAAVYNIFNVQRHITSAQTHRTFRAAALNTWREVVAVA
jgi:hypothetical protein